MAMAGIKEAHVMTDKQTHIMLALVKAKIAENNKAILDKLDKHNLADEFFPLLAQNEVLIGDMITIIKPTIKICRCGNEMDGKFKLCHKCRKVKV